MSHFCLLQKDLPLRRAFFTGTLFALVTELFWLYPHLHKLYIANLHPLTLGDTLLDISSTFATTGSGDVLP